MDRKVYPFGYHEIIIYPFGYKVNISIHSFEEEEEKNFENYMEQVTAFADAASRKGIIVVLRLWNRGYDEGRNEKILSYLKNRLSGEWAENTKGIRIRKTGFLYHVPMV